MAEVTKPDGLSKRGSIWYYRQRWPKRYLKEGEVRSDYWKSLGTGKYTKAIELLPAARLEADHFFQIKSKISNASGIQPTSRRLKRPENPALPILQPIEAERLAIDFFSSSLKKMDANPILAKSMTRDAARSFRDELNDRSLALSGVPGQRDDDPIDGLDNYLLSANGFRCDRDSEVGNLLHEYLRRASIQLNELQRARFDGDFSNQITDGMFAGEARNPQRTDPKKSISIGRAAALYRDQLSKDGLNDKTMDRYANELKHIVAFFGEDLLMSAIDAHSCDKFKDTFTALPPNFQKKIDTLGIDYAALSARKQDRLKKISWATVAKYLRQLDRFFEWASKHDYLEKNYAAGLRPSGKKPRGSVAKLPFEKDELERVVARPIYTGCVDDTYGFNKVGPNIIRRSRYWAPLIALYAGLRSGEILQLTPRHFRTSPLGNPFIVLTPDMKLKNGNAEREIPVHSVLQKIGLVNWVRRRNNVDGRLFNDVEADKYQSLSSSFSKRFRTDLKHLQLGERRPKLTFHSFRHTFKRALDHADVIEEKKEELCGWSRETRTSRRYGDGLVADQLKDETEKVDYGLDLDHLYRHGSLRD